MNLRNLAVILVALAAFAGSRASCQENIGEAAFSDEEAVPKKVIRLKNESDARVSVCLAWLDAQEGTWVTAGHMMVDVGETSQFTVPTSNETIYYYASSKTGTWGGETPFSITEGAFRLRLANSRFPSFIGKFFDLNFDGKIEVKQVKFEKREFEEGEDELTIRFTD